MLTFSHYFYFSLAAFLLLFSSPEISQAQSSDNSGYSPVEPQEYCADCDTEEENDDENTSPIKPQHRSTRVDIHQYNYNSYLITNYPDKKSPWLAFGLEFFIGWGTGHFYAGNYGWGIYGLSGLLSLIYGAIQMGNTNFEMGIWFMVYGGISRFVNIVSAPIVTMNRNEEKKKKYLLDLREKGLRPHQFRGFQTDFQWEPETPYTRIQTNKSLVIPIFHTTF